MKTPEDYSKLELIASSKQSSKYRYLRELNNDEAWYLGTAWKYNARPSQLPPEGDWNSWLFLGGRGAGKTRAGAEWVAGHVRRARAKRIGLIAATHFEARAVMVEGESGLLGISEGAEYEPSLRRVRWSSGAEAHVLSAEEPDSIRGFQFDLAWADEFCKWADPQSA
ncbi:MAG TPA: terminase family protein, partial [Rhizomicrobium sp.]